MEDHLKNKGRLQREWDVLCRYEAEPSARDAALQAQCAQLNRQSSPLPVNILQFSSFLIYVSNYQLINFDLFRSHSMIIHVLYSIICLTLKV